MGRENVVFLRGAVAKAPMIIKNDLGEPIYAQVFINVGRDPRNAGDNIRYMKGDSPMIITREPQWAKEIETWDKYDIVNIMGTFTTRIIGKTHSCPYCHRKQQKIGQLAYVYPVFAEKICHLDTPEECMKYIVNHREISNRAIVLGTLCHEPRKYVTKQGVVVTQFPIIIGRNIRIPTDSPDITTDCPWVKSYGENAKQNKLRLLRGSEVLINGCIQTRDVMRRSFCGQEYDEKGRPLKAEDGTPKINPSKGCGKQFEWKDRATELLAQRCEYLNGYYTDEDLKEMGISLEELPDTDDAPGEEDESITHV